MPSILHGASEAFGFAPEQYSVLRGGSLCVEACLILHTSLQAESSRLLPYKSLFTRLRFAVAAAVNALFTIR